MHQRLEEYPRIRNGLRDVYQRLLATVPQRDRAIGAISERPGFFYGFHHTSPWSPCNQLLLSHRCDQIPLRMPRAGDAVDIGYFSGPALNTFTRVGDTRAWTWQQGSMLQWLGSTGLLVYNDYVDGRDAARIVDVNGGGSRILDGQIAAVSSDGALALGYTFGRYRIGMPGYEYASPANCEERDPSPSGDGLYRIETDLGAKHLIVSLATLKGLEPAESSEHAYHFVSHCVFSPGGSRVAFFHRWRTDWGVVKTRLITCNTDGSDLFLFTAGEMLSHFGWRDDATLVVFGEIVPGVRSYYLVHDKSAIAATIGSSFFHSDGHPQLSPNGRFIVTDTYPDRHRSQSLLLFDLRRSSGVELARLRIPFRFRNELRCDFHPRWDRTGEVVSFDSAHRGVRSHCTLAAVTRQRAN